MLICLMLSQFWESDIKKTLLFEISLFYSAPWLKIGFFKI